MKRIIFAGTPEIAEFILASMLQANYPIIACLTQPDRPTGRGHKLIASPVKQLAIKNKIPVYQFAALKSKENKDIIKNLSPDLIIVVAYGLIIPKEILAIPKYGCINVHASLLPRWRGAAPIQHAILAGDEISGVTIMRMDEGLDTGDILTSYECALGPRETSADLYKKLCTLGSKGLLETLNNLEKNTPIKQDSSIASYAPKINKQDARINWCDPAIAIDRQIRAFIPWPIAFTNFKDIVIKVWEAIPLNNYDQQSLPGTILVVSKSGMNIATGAGVLRITKIQLPNKKVMTIEEILNGHPDFVYCKQRNYMNRGIK